MEASFALNALMEVRRPFNRGHALRGQGAARPPPAPTHSTSSSCTRAQVPEQFKTIQRLGLIGRQRALTVRPPPPVAPPRPRLPPPGPQGYGYPPQPAYGYPPPQGPGYPAPPPPYGASPSFNGGAYPPPYGHSPSFGSQQYPGYPPPMPPGSVPPGARCAPRAGCHSALSDSCTRASTYDLSGAAWTCALQGVPRQRQGRRASLDGPRRHGWVQRHHRAAAAAADLIRAHQRRQPGQCHNS